jgi:tetratricopeptide (TPR) repeat protein
MRQTPLGLILAGILAVSAAAAESPAVPAPVVLASGDASQAAPELVRLDRELTKAQQAKEQGLVAPEKYEAFRVRFRAELDAAKAGAPPSPADEALYSRLLARLGESAAAAENLTQALATDPKSPALHAALSQVRFDGKNYPAALAEADAALALDPGNRDALALKYFSAGRVAMNGGGSGAPDPSLAPPARRPSSRRFHFAAPDPATLPYKLPVKISPAPEPPALPASALPAAPSPGPLPLLPLALTVGLGAAAFEVSRSRGAYASADGLDDEHPKPVGKYQRLVAGTILAGAAGALIYLSGSALVSAAPAALAYMTNAGTQGLRLAASEAGAINPREINATNDVPRTFARIIAYLPGQEIPDLVGQPGKSHAFVTAAEDIEGLTARQLETRLGIDPAPRYLVIRFPALPEGLATPIDHIDPRFIGEGLTTGGAREFLIPNGPMPPDATYEIVK